MHRKLKALETTRKLLKTLREVADGYPPIPRMKAKMTPHPLIQVKERDITFIGFREVDGKKYCFIAASQMWSDAYFAQLDAQNPGPRGTPKGEQWKMLIPYDEVMAFFEAIKEQGKEG